MGLWPKGFDANTVETQEEINRCVTVDRAVALCFVCNIDFAQGVKSPR